MNPLIWAAIYVVSAVAAIFAIIKCCGLVVIGDDEAGIITKSFRLLGAGELPPGRQFALNGEPGVQVDLLGPGWHFCYWPWQYSVEKVKAIAVPEGQIGLVIARDGAPMPNGRVLADYVECDSFQNARAFLDNGGVKGKQAYKLRTGLYRINTRIFQVITATSVDAYNNSVRAEDKINPSALRMLTIEPQHIGIVTCHDGKVLPEGHTAAPKNDVCDAFQDEALFISAGGYRGLQDTTLRPGTWVLNPWFVDVEVVPMTHIDTACCGVVVSYVGEFGKDISGDEFLYSNIVENGFKGVWKDTLGPGLYAINTRIMDVHIIPTSNFVLNFDVKNEVHGYDNGLGPVRLRSKDGFEFSTSIQQIIHVPHTVAPMLISRFGSMQRLIDNQLEPLVSNYFRNVSQKHDVLTFNDKREERQQDAKHYITAELRKFNVEAVDTLIGEIMLPAALMKTVQDRKTAEEQQSTYASQARTEEARAEMERKSATADSQRALIESEQQVLIANQRAEASKNEARGRAEVVKITAEGDSEGRITTEKAELEVTTLKAKAINLMTEANTNKIKLEGEATMAIRQLELNTVGASNYTAIKIAEAISGSDLKLVPDIMIGSNGQGGSSNENLSSLLLANLAKGMNPTPAAVAPGMPASDA